MDGRLLLLLDDEELAARTDALFQQLSDSEGARAALVADPNGTLARALFPDAPAPSSAVLGAGNRLLLALLENPEFMEWARAAQRRYEQEIEGILAREGPTAAQQAIRDSMMQESLYREAADAMTRYADPDLISDLMQSELNRPHTVQTLLAQAPYHVDQFIAKPVNVVTHQNFAYVITAVATLLFVVITVFDATPLHSRFPSVGLKKSDLLRISTFLAENMGRHRDE